MPLKNANSDATERFEDGAAWLVLRTQLSKGERDRISDLNSNYRVPAALLAGQALPDSPDAALFEVRVNSAEINRLLFDFMAVEWSMHDEKPSAADYDALDDTSGMWVDGCVNEALAIGRGRVEKKSSKKASSSRATSRRARQSAGNS